MVLLLLLIGIAVLIYHTSYYSLRGGGSGTDANCGAFFVVTLAIVSVTHWYYGAALSFILHIILFVLVFQLTEIIVVYFILVLIL